jgi:hypothetical protein
MTKIIPCVKFRNADLSEWIAKLAEETAEVVIEAKDYDARRVDNDCFLAEELTDVITVCTSWLEVLGYGEKERAAIQAFINEKNRARGYHEEAGNMQNGAKEIGRDTP